MRPYRLKRGIPLPGDVPPIPEPHRVEGLYDRVPIPDPIETFPATIQDAMFTRFAAALASGWPEGVTATEWATLVNRDVHRVRVRKEALVAEELLVHDHVTDRYGVLFWSPFDT